MARKRAKNAVVICDTYPTWPRLKAYEADDPTHSDFAICPCCGEFHYVLLYQEEE